MQTTSMKWKETLGCYDAPDRPNIVPISYVEITYSEGDDNAQRTGTASDNGHAEWSDVQDVLNQDEKSFQTFALPELNLWLLDGSREIKPDTVASDVGFVDDSLSDERCEFSNPPIMIITWPAVNTDLIPGLHIEWSSAYGGYAVDYTIRAYNGTTLNGSHTVTGNTEVSNDIEFPLSGYDRIEIEVSKWSLPLQRVRAEDLFTGRVLRYRNADLLSYSHKQSADLMSAALPENKIEFTLDNSDSRWNPDNPTGTTRYLLEAQRMDVRYGYKLDTGVEWIKGGVFFLAEWDTPSNGISASFVGGSLLSFMDGDFSFVAGTYTLYDLALSALNQADLPTDADGSVKWNLDEGLKDISVTLSEDDSYTQSEILQLCANAAQMLLWVDRDGNINVGKQDTNTSDYVIDTFVSYQHAEYKLTKPLKSVSVNDGQGTASNGATGEVQKISNDLIQSKSVANGVAEWVRGTLAGRKVLSGSYRADPRLDALDVVTVKNKYAENAVRITDVEFTFNGAFRGSYEGRVFDTGNELGRGVLGTMRLGV